MDLKLDIHSEDLMKLIFQLPDDEKQKLKNKLEADLKKPKKKKIRKAGFMKGLVKYMAPDFDAPLDDFKDYM